MKRGLQIVAVCVALSSSYAALGQAQGPAELFRDALETQQRGDLAAAVGKYEHLLQLYPATLPARANLAVALVALGRFDDGIKEYRTALVQAPDNFDLRLNLGIACYTKGDFSAAATELEPLHSQQPNNSQVALLLADSYSRTNRDADAISVLLPVETAEPQNLGVVWALGSALIRVGRPEEGLPRVERVAREGLRAEAYAVAADTYLKLTELDKARASVEEAARLNPDLPGLHTLRGNIMDSAGDREGAIGEFQKAVAINPNDFEAELRWGAILYSHRKLDEAAAHVKRSLEIEPSSVLARYELGRIQRAQGDFNNATKTLEGVVQDDPDWLPPHVELVALYYRLNRPADGTREKEIVDRLRAEEQQRPKSRVVSPMPPSN